jgi:hypothetical protein
MKTEHDLAAENYKRQLDRAHNQLAAAGHAVALARSLRAHFDGQIDTWDLPEQLAAVLDVHPSRVRVAFGTGRLRPVHHGQSVTPGAQQPVAVSPRAEQAESRQMEHTSTALTARCRFCGHRHAPTQVPRLGLGKRTYAGHNIPGGIADHDGAACFKSKSQTVWPKDVNQ